MTRTPEKSTISGQGKERRRLASQRNENKNDRSDAEALGNIGAMSNRELVSEARRLGSTQLSAKRTELALEVLLKRSQLSNITIGAGILDVHEKGYGFLRPPGRTGSQDDIYVPNGIVRKHGMRQGDFVAGPVKSQGERTRGRGHNPLLWPELVNGRDVQHALMRPKFERLTSVYPDEQLTLETTHQRLNTRIIDIIAPIGKGQRALIVAPPKAGKTVMLKDIAHAVAENYPAIHIIVSLIGERPEEVTDMRRSVHGEVYSSTFDEQVEHQCETSDRALERAKRLVESGEDVLLVLDSLTRLARAFNVKMPSSGKTLSGGMDPLALYPPKQFFGAARNCEEGGSLTIVATALIDTGSRLDDLIYEEFKGTGNMELHLDRSMAERRIWPAVAMERSGTRHEELLQSADTLRQVWLLRRMLALFQQQSSNGNGNPTEGAERILERLKRSPDNDTFLKSITEK